MFFVRLVIANVAVIVVAVVEAAAVVVAVVEPNYCFTSSSNVGSHKPLVCSDQRSNGLGGYGIDGGEN